MITSTRNPKIQLIRRLLAHPKARREARAFVVEGVRLVEEVQQAGWNVQSVLYSDDLSQRGLGLVEGFAAQGVSVEQADPAILKVASDTQTPQGILAVVDIQPLLLPPVPNFVLLLDKLRDPGNLGTILRTASAVGVQAVLLSPATADPFAPKVLRSAMGAHFRLPIHTLPWPEIRAYLGRGEAQLIAGSSSKGSVSHPLVYVADAAGELVYTQADFRAPVVLVIGGEAEGAGPEAQALTDHRIAIPMPGHAESLNAAVAAAILMFEVVRQRTA